MKYDIDFVRKKIEEDNYILLSNKYFSSSIKLELRCGRGHKCFISFSNWLKGVRCAVCRKEDARIEKIAEIRANLFKYGYKLIGPIEGVYNKYKVVCPKNHTIDIYYTNFLKGIRCGLCYKDKKNRDLNKTIDIIKNKGYTYLRNYKKRGKTYIKFICNGGHMHELRVDRVNKGHECGKCFDFGGKI